ncbi:MAG: ABC transporter substrate-binding protein [Dehalococcoidia bacterium]|nr:ABC transporter substrate-binding protein [Dehalococcoidia bacterium]
MNKKSLLIFSIGLIIMLVAVSFAGCTTPQPTGEKTLRVGMILGITGFFSVREVPDMNQAQFAADIINEEGGIKVGNERYKVELVVADTKSTMDGVTAAANKLVFDEKVKFVIGPTAFFAAAAGPILDPNKVLRFITWCVNTPGEVDASTPYAFMAGNGSVLTSSAAVKYLKENYPNVKKVSIVTPDDGAPPFVIPIAKNLLGAQGITVVGDPVIYPNETQDFSAFVAKLNAIKDADAILMQNGLVPHMGALVKGLRESGNYKPYAGSLPARASQVVTIAGADAMKDVFSIAYTPNDPKMPPIAKEIIERTAAKYGVDYQLEMSAPNCLWVIKEGIEAAKSLDPTVVKQKLESMDEVETIFGSAKISGEKSFGIKHVVASPQAVQIFKNGAETSAGWIDLGYIP